MYLKSIELTGFKSFAKKSELFFNSPISAIVGPNGSGKSNIAEAFRFVLGEQSIKSLRGKKGEDLIFNGTGDTPRSNRASVKVVFDNTNKIFNVDFSEVSLERVVHRDGINEYFINGSLVRLKDIIELLSSAHIGASGHHIISQGEADKILNANIKERKSMIEDALGLKIYQYKRIESEKKLNKTLENIAQVESLRKEIAPHLRFLKKQVEKVEKSFAMKDELISLGKEYFKREDIYIAFSKEQIQTEKKPLNEKLEKLQKELSEAKKILSESGKQEKKNFEILRLEEEISKTRNNKDSLLREIGQIEGSISSEEKIIHTQQELANSNAHKTVLLKDIEEFVETIDKNIEDIEKENDISIIKKIVLNIKESFFNFIKSKKNTVDDSLIKIAEESLSELKNKKSGLDLKLGEIRKKEESLQNEYNDLKKEIENEKDSSRDAEKAVFRIMADENEIISKLNLLKSREEQIRLIAEEFKRELEEVGMLVGREVLDYKNVEIEKTSLALAEPRIIQDDRKKLIEKLKIRLEDSGITESTDVLKEYKDATERDEFLAKELADLEKSSVSLRELILDLEEKLKTKFNTGIEKINEEFRKYFSLMFGGGEASLSIVQEKKKKKSIFDEDGEELEMNDNVEDDTENEEGVDISVNLPKKKIKGLVMLSGGERALTSIALLFAISQVNPPPFIILDETDAALDEANSRKYGDMIQNLSKYSQLILITHNRETMSRAGIIYGVTMFGGGISKLLSIQFEEAVQVAK